MLNGKDCCRFLFVVAPFHYTVGKCLHTNVYMVDLYNGIMLLNQKHKEL